MRDEVIHVVSTCGKCHREGKETAALTVIITASTFLRILILNFISSRLLFPSHNWSCQKPCSAVRPLCSEVRLQMSKSSSSTNKKRLRISLV